MDSTAAPQNAGSATSKAPRYALSREVEEARAAMKKSARTANLINEYFPYAAAIPVILILWSMDLDFDNTVSLVGSFVAIAVGYVGFVIASHFLVRKVFTHRAIKKVNQILPGDPMANIIASHLNVPEDVARHAVHEMITDRSGWATFMNHDEVIKLKLDKKWDDFLKEDIRFVKVSRRPAVSVASELIQP